MLSRLASYLMGGAAGEDAATAEDVNSCANKENEGIAVDTATGASMPVEARLRQVEVDGDDWILIDRNGMFFFSLSFIYFLFDVEILNVF